MTALTGPAPAPLPDEAARQLIEEAVALELAGRNAEAIGRLDLALGSNRLSSADSARALYDQGIAYDATGKTQAAIADYSAALKLDPGLMPALNNRANAYRRAGRLDDAVRDYKAVLRVSKAAHEYAHYGLGLIAKAQGDTEGARSHFKDALRANPRYEAAAKAGEALAIPNVPKSSPAAMPLPNPPRDVRAPLTAHTKTGPFVQLGAYQTEAFALQIWGKLVDDHGDLLHGLTPVTEPVDRPGKGRLWRLRIAPGGQAAATALCASLKQRRLACDLVSHGP